MHKIKYLILLCVILFTGCSKDDPTPEETPNHTLIVYLGRDSNLSHEDEEKMKYILKGWDRTKANIIFYEDKKGKSPTLYKAIHENNENKAIILETYEEENSASVKVFSRVLQDAKKIAPAESYGLIFFSHASGWLPEGVFEAATRSIGNDNAKEMELSDFANAIPDGMFDYIVFEACFMASIETAYELRNKTDYILASAAEVFSPGFANIYEDYLAYLFQGETGLLTFAKGHMEYVKNKATYKWGTFSAIKTSELENLATFIKTNATEEFTGSYRNIQYFDRNSTHYFYDFETYFQYLIAEEKHTDLKQFIDKCVIYQDFTQQFYNIIIYEHCGLSTYIMRDEAIYLPENEAYKQLAWYKAAYNN